MTKKLLVVGASGLVLAVLLLSLAWVIGGKAFVGDLEHKRGWTIDLDDDDDEESGPRVTRSLAYDGSQPLTIDAPVSLRFVRGAQRQMTVEGRQDMMNALRWESGRLFLTGDHPLVQHTLKVTVIAPQIPGVILKGAGSVELNGLAQPSLAVNLEGAGNIAGNGKVGTLTIDGEGAGNVDFAKLEAGDATVKVAGAGSVDIAATGKVDLAVSGVGNVGLHRKPGQLTTRVTGIGNIDHDY